MKVEMNKANDKASRPAAAAMAWSVGLVNANVTGKRGARGKRKVVMLLSCPNLNACIRIHMSEERTLLFSSDETLDEGRDQGDAGLDAVSDGEGLEEAAEGVVAAGEGVSTEEVCRFRVCVGFLWVSNPNPRIAMAGEGALRRVELAQEAKIVLRVLAQAARVEADGAEDALRVT
jgi:hypothetical protein